MARRQTLQDGTGVMLSKPPVGISYTVLATTPTNSIPGYHVGSIWINTAGTIGSIVYVNTGSATSTTWTNIL